MKDLNLPHPLTLNQNDVWPKLKFYGGFDDRMAAEVKENGWIQFVLVELQNGKCYQVTFYDINNLELSLKRNADIHHPFEAAPGMIVLEKVTLENMLSAVKELCEQGEFGFFTYLKEWDIERDNKYFKKYYDGIAKSLYEYPTVSGI
ncbi:MAG: hypothetical protein JWO40_676 [Candidatus Doudnabacteria bacterium]|nr:hypothetical protein [Candidatus Doudnabacteria bacterium]